MTSWSPAGAYDPDKYYTEASDKNGRGDPVNTRIPPQIAGAIAALVQSAKIPEYRTQSDFIRDAVVHRLHTIGDKVQSGEIIRLVHMIAMLNEEVTAEREKETYQALIALIEARHSEYTIKAPAKAQVYLKRRLAEIDAIPEDFQQDYDQRLSARLYTIPDA